MEPACPEAVMPPADFIRNYLRYPFTFSAQRILQNHDNFWSENNFQALDEQFGDIRAYVTADIMVAASWIKTAFVADQEGVTFYTLQLALNAVALIASTSMTCLAFIRLSLKSLLIPKSKREENSTKKPEGNLAEMAGQEPNKPPQWELSYTTELCRKETYSKTEFDDRVVNSAFLKDVLERLSLFGRDQERVLMKEWFGDESSTAKTEDLEGETSFGAEDEEKDVIKKWIHRALKIFNFSDFPPRGTHPDDKGNLPRFVFVLEPKASTQLAPEQKARPQTDSTSVPGSTDQSAAGTSDSRSEQGSQKESEGLKRCEIGGSSGNSTGNAKKGLQARIARKLESGEFKHWILERTNPSDDLIDETHESLAPPPISLMLQLLNYSYDLGRKIANLKISGVLPLPDSKKEDVKAIFAGLQKCLEALKLATMMKKKCGKYELYLSNFSDWLSDIFEEPDEFLSQPGSSQPPSSSGDPAKLRSRGQTTKRPHPSATRTGISARTLLEKANCTLRQLLEDVPTEALGSSDEAATDLSYSLKFFSFQETIPKRLHLKGSSKSAPSQQSEEYNTPSPSDSSEVDLSSP